MLTNSDQLLINTLTWRRSSRQASPSKYVYEPRSAPAAARCVRNRLCPGARGGAGATTRSFCGQVFSPHLQENNEGKESVSSSCTEQAPYSFSCGSTLGGGAGGMGGETSKAPSSQRGLGLSGSLQPGLFEWTAFSVNEQKLWPRIPAEREKEPPAALSGFGLPP